MNHRLPRRLIAAVSTLFAGVFIAGQAQVPQKFSPQTSVRQQFPDRFRSMTTGRFRRIVGPCTADRGIGDARTR